MLNKSDRMKMGKMCKGVHAAVLPLRVCFKPVQVSGTSNVLLSIRDQRVKPNSPSSVYFRKFWSRQVNLIIPLSSIES